MRIMKRKLLNLAYSKLRLGTEIFRSADGCNLVFALRRYLDLKFNLILDKTIVGTFRNGRFVLVSEGKTFVYDTIGDTIKILCNTSKESEVLHHD